MAEFQVPLGALEPRITDPQRVDAAMVKAILARGARPTIQFSRSGASTELLASVNELCREFGDRLEVRFFGHHSETFDGGILTHIPDVHWLSLDCLMTISGENNLAQLPNLTKLTFGVYRFDKPDFLDALPLERFTWLSLGENAKKNINLRYLDRCGALEHLFLAGHTRGIEAISRLPKLSQLWLGSIPKKQTLEFLSDLAPLRSLNLILGGRRSLDEFRHPDLEELAVLRVRGVETLGSLGRFPKLRKLQVEDQLQLRAIDLTGAALKELILLNCKNLETLSGLDDVPGLQHLRASRTSLDLDALVERVWPPSMDILALYSGSERWNTSARAKLDQRGYREFGEIRR